MSHISSLDNEATVLEGHLYFFLRLDSSLTLHKFMIRGTWYIYVIESGSQGLSMKNKGWRRH